MNSKQNNSKGFIIPLVVILVVLIGIGGIYYLGILKSKKVIVNATPVPIVTTKPLSDSLPKSTVEPKVTPALSLKTLKYSLPNGWSTSMYGENIFSVGFDPVIFETKIAAINTDNSALWIVKKNTQTPYSNSYVFSTNKYNGGSRHKFIYDQIGETPTKNDLYSDYKELEYIISGKSCLILDGISISQYPVVWVMCSIGDKAILMTTFDRNGYMEILKTLKIY